MAALYSTALALFGLFGSNLAAAVSEFDIRTSWGNLSPYTDAPGFGIPKGFPAGCELSQVHVLHRHGQRYPTPYPLDGGTMVMFSQKLANYSKKNPDIKVGTGPLEFLDNWQFTLGYDVLLPQGAATEAAAGAQFWSVYGHLLYRAGLGDASYDPSLNVYPNGTARPKPTFRTTSKSRIVDSARWWLSGFFSKAGADSSSSEYELTIIPEQDHFNNTLSPRSTCTNGSFVGYSAAETFGKSIINGALERLSQFLPHGFGLDSMDVQAMFSLCPYEYAALGQSSFCSLFTEQEWRDFEYLLDLSFYGSPSGRANGIGYVLELAARLQSRLIMSSDAAFKAGSHGLPTSVPHAPPHNRFHMSQIAPFGGRLFTEVWTCPKDVNLGRLQDQMYENPNLSSRSDVTGYVRFVLNNAPVPLDGLCDNADNGFCPLDHFLSNVLTLNKEALYQKACFGNYNIPTQVANGQPIQT